MAYLNEVGGEKEAGIYTAGILYYISRISVCEPKVP